MSSFLRRWAERKAETRQPQTQRQTPTDPQPELSPKDEVGTAAAAPLREGFDRVAPRPAAPEAAQPDAASPEAEEIAARLAALPALEEIGPATDVRPFLQNFVPAALRKAALRRAWAADPIISTHLDVARDYAWEFNDGPLPVGFGAGLKLEELQRSLDQLGPLGAREAEADEGAQTDTEATTAPSEADPEPHAVDEQTAEAARGIEAPKNQPSAAAAQPDASLVAPLDAAHEERGRLTLKLRHGSALPS